MSRDEGPTTLTEEQRSDVTLATRRAQKNIILLVFNHDVLWSLGGEDILWFQELGLLYGAEGKILWCFYQALTACKII